MPIDLATGVTVRVAPPVLPVIAVSPPVAPSVRVVPVAGPTGPKGDPGDGNLDELFERLEVLEGASYAYTHLQPTPVLTVQVLHALAWKPAGITCVNDMGDPTEYDSIAYPAPGITEITFGGPGFAGAIYLS